MTRILRLPATTLTTRHSPVIYPWQHSHALPPIGVPIGVNALAGGVTFRYDPWAYYRRNVVSSPNMIVAGQLGRGKSTLVKTYLHRQLRAHRQAYVLDPKGEYRALAVAGGLTEIRLHPGGRTRLNPLDQPPGLTGREQITTARTSVVAALAAAGMRRDLIAEEHLAITAALRTLPDRLTLTDLVAVLLAPSDEMARGLSTSAAALTTAIRPVALELQRLLHGDLAGMLDGHSTVELDPFGPGAVIDLSAVTNRDALTAVMVGAGAWLTAAINADTERRRLLLVDEAWALLASPATTGWLQQVSKLARAHGIQLITVIHRFSDLAAQSDTGTAVQAQAQGLLADAETRVLYGQAPSERHLATELLGLSGPEADLVCSLGPHRALWRIGEHTAVIDHVVGSDEWRLVDTDQRMQP
jgi:type IV secretory pathway VirB4 component